MRYIVKPGYTHGAYGQHTEGEIVELTPVEASGFLDKLAPMPEPEPAAAVVTPETGKAKKPTE